MLTKEDVQDIHAKLNVARDLIFSVTETYRVELQSSNIQGMLLSARLILEHATMSLPDNKAFYG